MEANDTALRAHYELGMERQRLSDGRGELEFTRTTEIVERRLPAAPAVVADIGGGPGRYALWLASLGYQVEHRDLMPLHVEQLTADAAGVTGIRTAVGDARDLDLPDASVDAVLLLGPLYHLTDRAERVGALRECARIVRPGGPVFAAVISRWAVRVDGTLRERLYLKYPAAAGLVDEIDRTGLFPPLAEGAFTSFPDMAQYRFPAFPCRYVVHNRMDNEAKIGRTFPWNNAFQYHVSKKLWPEIETNYTRFQDGPNRGKTQVFMTPGILFGNFHVGKRLSLNFGGGFQVATTRFHVNNHNGIFTVRFPF